MNKDFVKLTMGFAIALVLLGVVGFFATGSQSVTALIPSFFGIVVLIVAMIFKNATRPTVGMAILFALALIGLVATIGGVPKVFSLMGGGTVERPAAAISQSIMAVLSLIYGVVCLLFLKKTGRNGGPND